MLKFDKDASIINKKTFEGTFLNCKSILYYIDLNVNSKLYDFLESELNGYYSDNKEIELEFQAFDNKKTIGIWIKLCFNRKDDCSYITRKYQSEFEQVYQELQQEFETQKRGLVSKS